MSEQESSVEVICVTRGSRPSTAPDVSLCNLDFSLLVENTSVHNYSLDFNVRVSAVKYLRGRPENMFSLSLFTLQHVKF